MSTYIPPRKALNKAYLKVRPQRSAVESFHNHLQEMLQFVNEQESEEYHKHLVVDFLHKGAFGHDYFINTKGRKDLVIHNGKNAQSPVGLIVEAKKPGNRTEMVGKDRLNTKAMQELLLYYLRERFSGNNLHLRHLVITNIYEWFVFDSWHFEGLFANDKHLLQQFIDFEAGRLSGTSTDFFYREIAAPAIEAAADKLEYAWFDLRDYQSVLKESATAPAPRLLALYKFFTPEHLLKLPFANDSNSLDRAFYSELLHIIGLTERKEKGKKLIERKPEQYRHEGSLLENTIDQLDSLDVTGQLENPSRFGANRQEQLFNIALELVITWINRILFLKLLEAQLISYHKSDRRYGFLHQEKIPDFDTLNSLFFQVLARLPHERKGQLQEAFAHVPYLNSSLFEPGALERESIYISNLSDRETLPLLSTTVLKDAKGNRSRGEMKTLHYLFAFLDAYDFASEGKESVQEENKSLINASVLGLIFEKINGYHEGSFFTPGFITMYMSRQSIRRAVVQKFNEVKGWNCHTLDQVYDRIDNRKEANRIVNSLKIVDPAVGSGHFLVSALNELIAIKNDLKILQDRSGKRLKEYQVEVVNDELVITDDDGELFEYRPQNKESQRVQEALFQEKQALIENCLFGVDINSNSVKICRLRLWIELLKNAYYNAEGQLETFPNIDINIKQGNSLISRFDLEADLSKALRQSKKWSIESYRLAVQTYRASDERSQKREMEQLINDIKGNFRSEISRNDPKVKKLNRLSGELQSLLYQNRIFERTPEERKAIEDRKARLREETEQLNREIEAITHSKIYENAFEWRFEFPEVLDEQGNFIGFDVVIGNPPYIRQEDFKELKPYLSEHYPSYKSTADLYVYFIELGLRIVKNHGEFAFIVANKWMRADYGDKLRKKLKTFHIQSILDFGDLPVFEEATTYPCVLEITRSKAADRFRAAHVKTLEFSKRLDKYLKNRWIQVSLQALDDKGWVLTGESTQKVLSKLQKKGKPLGEYVKNQVYYGIKTGLNEAFVIDAKTKDRLIAKDPKSEEIIKPFLAGKDIKRYQQPKSPNYLILFKYGDTRKWFGELNEREAYQKMKEAYPAIMQHLNKFKTRAKKRYDQGQYWWELRACDYYEEFEKPKIVYPNICSRPEFIIDTQNQYTNQKCFIIPYGDEYLLGLLNSKLMFFLFKHLLPKLRGGFYEPSYVYFKTFPIETPQDATSIKEKVRQILSQKQENPEADTTALEREIDVKVFRIYGLSYDEVLTVAPQFWLSREEYEGVQN